jgi:hypothetical protein
MIQELAEIGIDRWNSAVARAFRAADGRDLGHVRHGRTKNPERLDRAAFRLEEVGFVLLEFGNIYPKVDAAEATPAPTASERSRLPTASTAVASRV